MKYTFFNQTIKTINIMHEKGLFEQMGKIAGKMNDLYVIPQELAAIWLRIPVMTNYGVKVRITEGMLITVNEFGLSLSDDNFNKKILACYGTLIDQFRIKVEDLKTGEQSIINL